MSATCYWFYRRVAERALPVLLSVLALPTLGHADTAPWLAASSPSDTRPLEEVSIVGSRLPQSTQSPEVTVVTQAQMAARGYSTVQQALRELGHATGGMIDQQLAGSFTPAAAAVNLRDLGVGRTLILLDGHRLPMYPLGVGGTDNFVDVSSIPLGAVERIEVLGDGASAVYGSDAMAGVINIVLKQTPSNELALYRSGTTQGGGDQQRWQLNVGAASERGSALFMTEYHQQKSLWYSQRERSRYDRLGGWNGAGPGTFSPYGYPGTFANAQETSFQASPGCDPISLDANNICQFNRADYQQLRPEVRSWSMTTKLNRKFTESLEAFSTLMYRDARTIKDSPPLSVDTLLDLGVPVSGNPFGSGGSYLRRVVELGPDRNQIDTRTWFALGGLKGKFNDTWAWSADLQTSQQRLKQTERGLGLVATWTDALSGNKDFNGDGVPDPVDITQRIPDDIARQLNFTAVSRSRSALDIVTAQLNGELWRSAAGPVKFAAVGEYARERYRDQPDAALVANEVIFRKASVSQGKRTRSAAGVELQWPLLTQLTLNVAARYDRYTDASDLGGAISPRITLDFKPQARFSMRAVAGRNFRAPDMQRMYGGSTTGFATVINSIRCKEQGGSGPGDASVASCVTPVFAQTTTASSLQLREETGNHYSFGARWQLTDHWNVSADYFLLDLKNLVQTPDRQYVLDEYAANGNYAEWITLRNTTTCPFTQVCLDLRPINIAAKKTSGIDANIDGRYLTSMGTFSLGLSAEYLLQVRMRESLLRPEVDVLANGKLGEAARLKGGVDLGWSRGTWRSNAHVSYVSAFTPVTNTLQSRLASFTTVNVSIGHELATQTDVQLGINNVFNREPPIATYRGNLSAPFFHEQFHTLDGRMWTLTLRQHF